MRLRCPKCGYQAVGEGAYCPMDGSPLEADRDPMIGQTLGDWYTIIGKIAEGGMGAVYRAEHLHVPGKTVAIKIIRPEFSRQTEYRRRFLREANTLMRSRHRHIVAGFDLHETSTGLQYMVMEYLTGTTVHDAIATSSNGYISISQTIHIMQQAIEALEHAHSLNIIHRDIKPQNLFLVEEDGDPNFLKILDFGLARPLDQTAITNRAQGTVGGTLGYLAPEAYEGGDYLSPALDVYALGCCLVEMLTGLRPFDSSDQLALMQAHRKRIPPRLQELRSDLRFPKELEELVRSMLAKKRAERPTTAVLRQQLVQLHGKLPQRSAQSVLMASTVLLPQAQQASLATEATEFTPDAHLRHLAGLVQDLERTESEREQAAVAATPLLHRLLGTLPRAGWSAQLHSLHEQWQQAESEAETQRQRLDDALHKKERQLQRIDGQRVELHTLIRKVRDDIRAQPASNSAERLSDEKTLMQLEQQFFSLKPDPALAKEVAQYTLEHQRVKHRSLVLLARLGAAVVAAMEPGATDAPRAAGHTDLDALGWSLDLLSRCNQNVEALLEDLPSLR